MDDTLLFIPPCCVDKKLPQAIMQAPRRALTFYTHGDVLMEKFYRAVSHLVVNPHVMVLTMPTIAPDTAVFLLQCFERGWVSDLVLSTCRDCVSLVDGYLRDYKHHVIYCQNKDVSHLSSHLVIYSSTQSITITGAMYDSCYEKQLSAYTMLFHANFDLATVEDYGNPLLNILLPDILRQRQVKRNAERKSTRLQQFLRMELPPYDER